ncbi:hypothetical protein [Azospirillum sp. TSO22-1]|uniref:hypothetical protein n=1 Tax=Azospirillum sp. TSO22-1 TaxID=716789 RepID=UPI000D659AE2|nr:hypothetical protein [Azospirillum sp. TSO22-1]
MKTALRAAAIIAVPLTLVACNETSNSYGRGGGLFGSSGSSYDDYSYRTRQGGGPYAHNGRCDDPSYNTSNGGNAERGTDQYDCRRYGNGLKR